MVTWDELEQVHPLAERARREWGQMPVAHLATVRRDGSPRMHPVCPHITQGRLYIIVTSASPKRFDLQNDGRFALHTLESGEPGPDFDEFEFNAEGRRSASGRSSTCAGPRRPSIEGCTQQPNSGHAMRTCRRYPTARAPSSTLASGGPSRASGTSAISTTQGRACAARRVPLEDAATWAAVREVCPYEVPNDDWLFELDIERALSATWDPLGTPARRAYRLAWRVGWDAARPPSNEAA